MNKPLLSHIIQQVISEKDRVYLPGFGTLLRTYIPAQFNEQENQFYPPTYQFELDRSAQYDDPYLIKVLTTDHQFDSFQATRLVNEYGEYLKNELSAKGAVDIQNVLTIQQAESQTVVLPYPTVSYEEYPTIDMNNLWEVSESNKGIWWEFSAFISIMLLILAGVYYMVNGTRVGGNYPYSSNYPPLIGAIVDSSDSEKTEFDSAHQLAAQDSPEVLDTTLAGRESGQDRTIIIVGSFANPNNQVEMKQKLEELGWQVYEEDINRMVRIGVLPEEHENVQEVLGLIRHEIEEEAWVLKKNQ